MNAKELEVFAKTLATSEEMVNSAFELIRLWRAGADCPGGFSYDNYLTAYRRFADNMNFFREYKGSYIILARAILGSDR